MIRRLPIYIVLDCSESMAGPAFDAVRSGLDMLMSQLRGNPQALETAWISIIDFGRSAKVVVPLTDITQFQMPKLVLGSGTAMGAALDLLEKQIRSEVVVQTAERKGDWKPICFILSDGEPTDPWEKSADRFKSQIVGKMANVIALACGPNVNIATLKRITETVLEIKDCSESSFGAFFKWVSASVQATSVKYSSGRSDAVELPGLPPSIEVAKEGGAPAIDQFIFLQSKCSKTKSFYLIRYKNEVIKDGFFGGDKTVFKFKAAHPLEDFDRESGHAQTLSVGSDQLENKAPCPYCSSGGWGMCSCGRVLCCEPQGGRYICPWCGMTADYSPASFDVGSGVG